SGVDPRPASLRLDHAGLAQDPQVVGDRRLADSTAVGEIAGTDRGVAGELADDRQAGRIGERLEQTDVGVDEGGLLRTGHVACSVSMSVYIDKYRYVTDHGRTRRRCTRCIRTKACGYSVAFSRRHGPWLER